MGNLLRSLFFNVVFIGIHPLSFWEQKTQNLAAHHSRSESGRLGDVKISDSHQTAEYSLGVSRPSAGDTAMGGARFLGSGCVK